MLSRIHVAGIQIYKRPRLLGDAIRKLSLKALYLPDRKRILLNKELPTLKRRWNQAHEIGHSIIPWHDDTMLGDNTYTLSRECQEKIESEANFAAGRLLFLQERFTDEVRSTDPSIEELRRLCRVFGNTLSTTLYRLVETVGDEIPVVGMITGHPHVSRRPADFDPSNPCRHFIRSPAFSRCFGRISDVDLFSAVSGYCGAQSGGPLGEEELILVDNNGDRHCFYFETFFNRYDALTLGRRLRAETRALVSSSGLETPKVSAARQSKQSRR